MRFFVKLSFHVHPSKQVPFTSATLRLLQTFKPQALAGLHHMGTASPCKFQVTYSHTVNIQAILLIQAPSATTLTPGSYW